MNGHTLPGPNQKKKSKGHSVIDILTAKHKVEHPHEEKFKGMSEKEKSSIKDTGHKSPTVPSYNRKSSDAGYHTKDPYTRG